MEKEWDTSAVRRLEALTSSAADAIVSADDRGIITDWNPAAEQIFGYARDEVIGQSLEILMPERFRHAHRTGMARVAAGEPSHLTGSTSEVVGLRKDGTEFPIELSIAKWRAGDVLGFSGIIRDATQRVQTMGQLARLSSLISSVLEGQSVNGRYRLDSLLDTQPYWVTYEATDLEQRDSVWLRILRPPMDGRIGVLVPGDLDSRICGVDHPHAVDLLDQGRTDMFLPFAVTEALSGESMAHHLERRRARGRRVDPGVALSWLEDVLSVISAAHAAGTVHSDVDAQHIFLHQSRGRASEIKLDCFGLHNHCRRAFGLGALSDRQDDVRGLGRLSYELLTGTPLTEEIEDPGERLGTLLPGLSQAFVQSLVRCLDSDPAARPTASEVHELVCMEQRERGGGAA